MIDARRSHKLPALIGMPMLSATTTGNILNNNDLPDLGSVKAICRLSLFARMAMPPKTEYCIAECLQIDRLTFCIALTPLG